MRKQLPGYIYRLLKSIGETGDEIGSPAIAVGGFVRDLLLSRANLDIDIVTERDGIGFAHAFAKARKGRVKSHQRFGTAVVTLPDGFKLDIATARTEIYTRPGALPSVKFSSIRDDLRRRDFTINAMAIELGRDRFGELVDFFGGNMDLQNGLVRILHNLSFADDPTRIFRAIRFEQRYGFSIESHTEELLRKAVAEDSLKTITMQRLRNEILLILKEDDPASSIQRMADFDLVKYIHPQITISGKLMELFGRIKDALAWWNSASPSAHEPADPVLLNLMALLDQLNTTETRVVSENLVLRKRYEEALRAMKVRLPGVYQSIGHGENPPSRIYETLKGIPLEALLFALAKTDESGLRDSISLYLTRLRKVRPLVNGNDLRKLGYPEGPLYARILGKTFTAQLDGLVADKREAMRFVEDQFPRYRVC